MGRVVSVLPDLRGIVRAMVRSLPPIGSLVVLTVLLMYVYGMVGWILFHSEDPETWGNIGESMLNLFVMLTLENWPILLERGQEIHPASWIFFVSYILIASFLVINVLIAIIINSMDEVHDAERAAERGLLGDSSAGAQASVAERLGDIRNSLDELEAQLAQGGDDGTKRAKRRPTKGGRMRG